MPQIPEPFIIETSEKGNVEPYHAYEDNGDHLNNIPWLHAYLHRGVRYSVSIYVAALANNGTLEVIINSGPTYNAHTYGTASVGGDFLAELYEDVTYTGGTALIPNNYNREVTTLSNVTTIQDPATSSIVGATLLETTWLPGGAGPKSVGTEGETRDEHIFKRDTNYLYRLTNLSGQTKPLTLTIDFYEHLPVGI